MTTRPARHHVPLYGWLTSEAISLTGTRVSMVALPWFVLTTTGSATQTGLVAFAEMGPLVLLKALGGPIIDRLGPRRVSIGCDLASVLVVGSIPLLHSLGALSFPLLLVLVALAGAFRGPGDAAKHAYVPVLVEHSAVPMERATGLSSTVERTAGMLGAAFAGGLVALVGAANALIVDALSFGVAALVLAWSTRRVGPPRRTAQAGGTGGAGGYWSDLRVGWDFLRHDRVLVAISAMVAVTNLLDMAYSGLLVPVWAKESGAGVGVVGLVFAVFSGTSIAGSLAAAAWGARLPRFRTYLFAFLLCGAPRFVVLALEGPLWAVLAVSVVGGAASGFINPVIGAVIFERIPSHLVGRVTSLTTALCYVGMPFGALVAGALVTWLGLGWALVACGAAYFLATMAPAVDPAFQGLDRRPSEPAPAESSTR